ncbi:MAG: heparinase II/III domain-containing protein [Gemmatimonadales bacterium]
MLQRRPIPPAEIRRRLPRKELAAWLWAALRDRLPSLPASTRPVARSRRAGDLARALRKAGLREFDLRIAALAEREGEGDLAAGPDLLVLAALSAPDDPRADAWLRRAHAALRDSVRRLEPHPRDWRFLAGLHALGLGGLAYDDADALAWRRTLLPKYWAELQAQVLDDGVPEDRSPGVLAAVLRDALAAHALWRAAGFTAPHEVNRLLRRMARAFARLSRPGLGSHRFGEGALVSGDAREGILQLAKSVLGEEAAEPSGPWALPASGYFGYALPELGVRLAVTAGRCRSGDLPACEHADAFSFELDVGGRAIVADPGPSTPATGSIRGWARTTPAHSTVTVDGTDQIELVGAVWSGERGQVVAAEARPDHQSFEFSGSIRHWGGPVHHRVLRCAGDALEIRDRVEGADGRTVRSVLHFAPEVRLQAVGRALEARAGSLALEITPFGATRLDVVIAERRQPCQGWYLDPARGAVPAPAVLFEQREYDGRELGCVLRWLE